MSENAEIILGILIFTFFSFRVFLSHQSKMIALKSGNREEQRNLMNDSIIEIIVEKLFSGSFSMLVMFGSTYCAVILLCTYLAAKGKIPINEYLVLVAGMSGTLTMFWKDYNQLKKEQPTNGGNGNGTKVNGNGSDVVNGNSSESGTATAK